MSGQLVEDVLRFLPEDVPQAKAAVGRYGPATVAESAARFGLVSLLQHYLPGELPDSREKYAAAFRATQQSRLTVRVLGLLQSAGIEALCLKGVAVSGRYYPDSSLRPSSDIDLLVRPRDAQRAVGALEASGLRLIFQPSESPFQFGHDFALVGEGNRLIELHFTPSWHFQARFDVDAMFSRAVVLDGAAAGVHALELHDDVVFLACHAAAHHFEGVKWLFDLKLALRSRELDWSRVITRAREARVATAVALTLEVARDRVGAQVPEWALRALSSRALRTEVARRVLRAVSPELNRTRSYSLDLLLADRMSGEWLRRATAPVVNRLARAAHLEERLVALSPSEADSAKERIVRERRGAA